MYMKGFDHLKCAMWILSILTILLLDNTQRIWMTSEVTDEPCSLSFGTGACPGADHGCCGKLSLEHSLCWKKQIYSGMFLEAPSGSLPCSVKCEEVTCSSSSYSQLRTLVHLHESLYTLCPWLAYPMMSILLCWEFLECFCSSGSHPHNICFSLQANIFRCVHPKKIEIPQPTTEWVADFQTPAYVSHIANVYSQLCKREARAFFSAPKVEP